MPTPSENVKIPTVTVAGYAITRLPHAITIAGMTITPGSPLLTLSGTLISVGSSALVVGSSKIPYPSSASQQVLATVVGKILSLIPAGVAIYGTTIYPGKAGMTINGTLISVDSQGQLVVSTQTDLGALVTGGFGTGHPDAVPSNTPSSTLKAVNSPTDSVISAGAANRARGQLAIILIVMQGVSIMQMFCF